MLKIIYLIINEINNECELEKSGLSDNGSSCEHISDITLPSNNTVFDFDPLGVGLAEFIVYGYVLDVVSNENEFHYGDSIDWNK